MNKISNNTIVIGPCRLSYMNVFKPKLNDMKGIHQYSAVLLIPKEPSEYLADPKSEAKAFHEIVKTLMAEKFGAQMPSKWRNPLQDGDTETNSAGDPKNQGYWFINCSADEDYRPALIDGAKREVKDGWNSGDWGKVKLRLYAYDQKGNKGVGCGLLAIQFLYKDESLGGGGNDDSGFEEEKVAVGVGAEEKDPFEDD